MAETEGGLGKRGEQKRNVNRPPEGKGKTVQGPAPWTLKTKTLSKVKFNIITSDPEF